MKHLLFIIVCLCVLFPHTGFAQSIDKETLMHITEAITIQFNFDRYWNRSWVIDQERELRLVQLSTSTYLAALELLDGDRAKRHATDPYQILLIRVDGVSPMVYFPGIPYTLRNLEEASKQEGQLLGLDHVTATHIQQIQEKGRYVETRFVLHTRDRIYEHGETWQLRVECLEARLLENIVFYHYQDGVVIIHDLIETDETFHGMMLANGGSKIIGLTGIMHTREPGGMYQYHCDLQETEPAPDHIGAAWLALLLRKPLIWNFRLNTDGKYLLERTAGW